MSTAQQQDLFDPAVMGRLLRNRGMAQAAARRPDAIEDGYRALEALAKRKPFVHIDDFLPVVRALEKRPDPQQMGTIWQRAKRNDLIEKTGEYRPCTVDALKHAHDYPVYRSLVFQSA